MHVVDTQRNPNTWVRDSEKSERRKEVSRNYFNEERRSITMACRGDEQPNTGETKEPGARRKRTVKPTPKALQNAIDSKR